MTAVLSDLTSPAGTITAAALAAIPTRTISALTGTYYLVDYYQPVDGTVSITGAGTLLDYYPAFNRIQALVTNDKGALIQLPEGDLGMSATFNMWKKLHIRGTNSGSDPATATTRLLWNKNMTGIRSWTGGAEVGYPGPALFSSTYACIEDVGIFCLDGSTASGHGIHMGSALRLNRVNVQNFGEDGVHILAANAGQGSMLGNNANQWYISDSIIRSNKGNGLYVGDADANAGVAIMILAGNNGGWDVYDRSFLGNTYIGVQCDAAGLGSFKTANATQTGSNSVFIGCYNENKAMALGPGALVVGGVMDTTFQSPVLTINSATGSQAQAVVNNVDASGTVTSILPIYEGTGYVAATVSVANQGDGSGLAVTPVIVGGKITSYTITNGGTGYVGHGYPNGSLRPNGSQGGVVSQGAFLVKNTYQGTSRYLEAAICFNGNELFTARSWNGAEVDYEEFQALHWNESARSFESLNGGGIGIRYVGKYTATETGGRSAVLDKGMVEFPSGLWLGGGSTGRQMTNGTAAPSSGEYAKGDIIWNTAPSAGGSMGWMCTTSGTAGSTAVFKAMPNLAA